MKKLLILMLVFCLVLCSCKNTETSDEPKEVFDNTNENEIAQNNELIEVNYDEKVLQTLDKIRGDILINGRCTFDENGLITSWPDSGIEVAGWFSGIFTVYYYAQSPEAHVHVVVDGNSENEKLVTLDSSGQSFVATSFQPGYHTVRISKAEEANTNKIWLRAIEYKGKIDSEPIAKTLKIEVIGDSISCGTGLNAPNGLRDDVFYAYNSIIARDFYADLSVVAVPGWALSKTPDGGEKQLVPLIYEKTSAIAGIEEPWDFENNQMDVVIINLGTNDYVAYINSDRTKLYEDMNKFLDTVRAKYPNAYIYWTYGMMNDIFTEDFKTIISERNDSKLSFIDVEKHTSGWGAHPDYEEHNAYAQVYESILRKQFKISSRIKEYKDLFAKKNRMAK